MLNNKQKVIVSSISDCREKNGIVTFMEILKCNAEHFESHGLKLHFVNFVDFPSQSKAFLEKDSPPSLTAQYSLQSNPTIKTRFKRALRGIITRKPLGAFLLFLCTLVVRAIVTAWKARRYDEPGCTHFYQDSICAFFGCFLHDSTARRIVILHSGDDALSQLFSHFPGMIGSQYEKFIRGKFQWSINRQHAVVTLSEKYAEDLRKQFPLKVVQCIYNTSPFFGSSIAKSRQLQSTDKLQLIAVGSLQYRKGFDLLIKAIALLPKYKQEKFRVTIVGGGPAYAELNRLITENQLIGVINLHGESDDVAQILKRSDIYILTSRDEGLPISLIEACSFGLPIITTRVGSIPEVFDTSSCKFIEPSEGSIKAALDDIWDGKIDLNILSKNSKMIFDSKLCMESFLNAYTKLLSVEQASKF